jgi:hypothetical protein
MRSSAVGKARAAGGKQRKPRSSFMSNLEQRWDERHGGES